MNIWVEVVSFSGYIYLFSVYCFIYIVCLPDHTVKRMMMLFSEVAIAFLLLCNKNVGLFPTHMVKPEDTVNQKTWRKNPLGLGQIQDLPMQKTMRKNGPPFSESTTIFPVESRSTARRSPQPGFNFNALELFFNVGDLPKSLETRSYYQLTTITTPGKILKTPGVPKRKRTIFQESESNILISSYLCPSYTYMYIYIYLNYTHYIYQLDFQMFSLYNIHGIPPGSTCRRPGWGLVHCHECKNRQSVVADPREADTFQLEEN